MTAHAASASGASRAPRTARAHRVRAAVRVRGSAPRRRRAGRAGATIGWIALAMVGARTLAMGLNRLIDAGDRRPQPAHGGPRAPVRPGHAPPGRRPLRSSPSALYLLAAFRLDPVVRWLWPIPVVLFVVYPYLKRVTWLCHLWLGVCLGLAPVGAWLATTRQRAVGGLGDRARRRRLGRRVRPLLRAASTSSTTGARGSTPGPRAGA